MRSGTRNVALWIAVVLVLLGGLWYGLTFGQSTERLEQARVVERVETAPMCPWREPEADLRRFFPGATGYRTQVRILSALRVELSRRLGRPPSAEENAVYLYEVDRGGDAEGTVLVRRVKGEYGAIEVVLAVNKSGSVRAVRIQRLREPPAITRALTAPEWLAAFRGQDAASDWRLGAAVPEVPAPARPSAQAVLNGVRSQLILLEVARAHGLRQPADQEEHANPGHP